MYNIGQHVKTKAGTPEAPELVALTIYAVTGTGSTARYLVYDEYGDILEFFGFELESEEEEELEELYCEALAAWTYRYCDPWRSCAGCPVRHACAMQRSKFGFELNCI